VAADPRFADLAALIASSKRANFARGVPEALIADAEQHLGLRFPPSYRWWLAEYGAGYVGGYELQGLFAQPMAERDPDLPLIGDIVDLARRNATSGWCPAHLLELLSYEGDEVYFFDTRRRSTGDEWPVVCIHAGTPDLMDVASSFAEWLKRELR
jgi:hypothetical protein